MKIFKLFVLIVFILILIGLTSLIFKTPKNINEQEIINKCSNLSLEKTSKCLTKQVNKFYKYNLTDDYINLTFEDLKNRGGDCLDWSILYKKLGNELNFYSQIVYLDIDETTAHAITFISNEEGYCMLSETDYFCRFVETKEIVGKVGKIVITKK